MRSVSFFFLFFSGTFVFGTGFLVLFSSKPRRLSELIQCWIHVYCTVPEYIRVKSRKGAHTKQSEYRVIPVEVVAVVGPGVFWVVLDHVVFQLGGLVYVRSRGSLATSRYGGLA